MQIRLAAAWKLNDQSCSKIKIEIFTFSEIKRIEIAKSMKMISVKCIRKQKKLFMLWKREHRKYFEMIFFSKSRAWENFSHMIVRRWIYNHSIDNNYILPLFRMCVCVCVCVCANRKLDIASYHHPSKHDC